MKEILGKERITLLIYMLVLNVALGFGYYFYFQPLEQGAVREYQTMRNNAQERRSEVRELKLTYVELVPRIGDYQKLKEGGFFNNQKRTIAKEIINTYRDRFNLLAAKYSISPADIVNDPRAEKADYAILRSPVNIKMEALDDVDIYNFISLMRKDFPGNLGIIKLNIQRRNNLGADLLQNIASGKPSALIEAEMQFNWLSMVQKSELDEL